MKTVVTSRMELEDKEITIDGYVHYTVEKDYGSDADGNRGEKRIFVDDVTDVAGYTEDLGKVALTKEDIEKAEEILAKEFLDE